ncbi:oxidoreductase [Klebsiella sp. H-Nf2]|uniref:glucose 1-dehydrogenase n=1 Tax=unclassified Klebsiella TaxID=2608929 RepID=UPI000C286AE4|nr:MULTISPECIES: glucose 1-dehydrogenase [unclassified Klebsiella]PJR52805.1 oxidoreductase [Klebsiella sp. H-Nf2]PJX45092.1 oxidoreductase [Klebsiella sp. C-Nf10]PJX55814.1 oxidoreductase [Klebsiella sp. D-Nf1]
MPKLANKVAIVTGASKGIGAGIARKLAEEGAAVVVNYVSDKAGAEAIVNLIVAHGGKAIAVRSDVTSSDQSRELVDAAITAFGRLDILVNNSGVYAFAAIEDVTEEHYRRLFDVNVLGTLLSTNAAVPHLGAGASIINISSTATDVRGPNSAVYTGTKGAVNAITGVLARELAPRGIRVNAVSPGYIVTEGTCTAGITGSEIESSFVAQTPLGRPGQPDDVAEVVAFLASEEARWVTGEVIRASGGIS